MMLARGVCLILLGASSAAAADLDAGKAVFDAQCSACHSVGTDEGRNGPSLQAIVGRKSGSLSSYDYSDAMSSAGLVWDAATLDTYLRDPRAKVAGTKMAFPGLPDASQRENVIAYLATLH